jgi:acetylornithine deacetylase/succinyl-diaminopimelate desuccinylase-like protein
MSNARDAAIAFAHNHQDDAVNLLKELLIIPSISTNPAHTHDMQAAADWLKDELIQMGFKSEVYQTEKHPIVYAENLSAGPQFPTVLIYGHYDVQPVEPLDLWTADPFLPSVQGKYLYARGASDMKGQIIASLQAVRSVLQQPQVPVNFKFLLEGEEEIGSPSLASFLKQHVSLLDSDIALNPDGGMISPENPTIIYGLRGLAYFELRVTGPAHDLHSGMYGGVVHNPAQALAELIAGMHDSEGRVTLPGFYDRVVSISQEERSKLSRLPMGEGFYLDQTGAPNLWGEQAYSPAERTGVRPTLEIHGLLSGFTGNGSKTVIPAWAMAKISSRLVPDQDPDEVAQQLRRYLQENAPETIHWELIEMGGKPAVITRIDLPAVTALEQALETVWGTRPVYKREGGSIPVVSDMQEILGVSSVVTGFGLPDDNIHAPNERLNLPNWYRGIDALIHFFYNLADTGISK